MNYNEIVDWLARDILGSTNALDEVEANVDRYLEDLTKSVQDKAEELAKLFYRPHVSVEYDRTYTGGDYDKVGNFAYIAHDDIDTYKREHGIDDDELAICGLFELRITNRIHIVHYDTDNPVDADGQELKVTAV